MKKKTNAVAVRATKEGLPTKAKKSRRGRKKEKVQISVRIDKTIMDLAYDHIKTSGRRITDMLERGLLLDMREQGQAPVVPAKVRYVVENIGVESQRRMLRVAVLDRMPEVRELTPLEQCFRAFYLTGLDTIESWPGYEKALELLGQPVD